MNMQQNSESQQPARQHQRFSWQPAPEDEVQNYAPVQQQVSTQNHQQHQPQLQHYNYQQQPQPRIQTDTNAPTHNRHFSYAQTPVEHEAFFYVASPTDPPLPSVPQAPRSPVHQLQSPCTPIDPRPQSMFNPLMAVQPQPQAAYTLPSSHQQDEKPPISPTSPHQAVHAQTFSPVSPVYPPQTYQQPDVKLHQSNHARNMSNLNPINTSLGPHTMPTIPQSPAGGQTSPLPQKDPITPISPNGAHNHNVARGHRQSYAHEPYSPHGFNSNQTSNLHAVFSPDAAHGPNGLDFAAHQPGQTTHPNMESSQSPKWSHSLCACSPDVSTCLTGLFCPCILYGRTSYRLNQRSAKKDPTDMLGHSSTNGHCMLMSLACGLWCLFPMIQRTRIRHAYKLTGDCAGDLAKGVCCCCCVAVQNEREVKTREEAMRRWAGPASTEVYTRPVGMVYKPQQ